MNKAKMSAFPWIITKAKMSAFAIAIQHNIGSSSQCSKAIKGILTGKRTKTFPACRWHDGLGYYDNPKESSGMRAFSIKENLIRYRFHQNLKLALWNILLKRMRRQTTEWGENICKLQSEKGLHLEYRKTLETGKSKKSVKNMRKEIF